MRIVCVMYAMQVGIGMRDGMHTGMVCYAGICVCYMMRYGYALCGTGRRDGVQVHGMRYAITYRKHRQSGSNGSRANTGKRSLQNDEKWH